MFVEPPTNWPALESYNSRISEIFERVAPIGESGLLKPAVMTLSPDAKNCWINFHDEVEKSIAPGGSFHDVSDVASKTAENAVRIATLFHVLQHGFDTPICAKCMKSGCRVAAWYLDEFRRFSSANSVSTEILNAQRLDRWLIESCVKESTTQIRKNHALQTGPLRKKEILDQTIRMLVELRRIRVCTEERAQVIYVNPKLAEVCHARG